MSSPLERPQAPRSSRVFAPERPAHVRSLTLICLAGGTAFGIDAALVESRAVDADDRNFELAVHANLPQSWHSVMDALSFVGNGGEMLGAGLVLTIILAFLRLHRAAILIIAAPAVALAMETILKEVFRRPRPHLWANAPVLHSFGFPSGHASGACAFSAALCWIALRHLAANPFRAVVAVVMPLFGLAVGLSRIYLGVHWPSDVLGGVALALFVVPGLILLIERFAPAAA